MTSVWPIARTPTTITCCRINERFCASRKRSLFSEKNAIVKTSATNGPTTGAVAIRRRTLSAEGPAVAVVSVVAIGSRRRRPGRRTTPRSLLREGSLYPQQFARPYLTFLEATPLTALAAIRLTPVSVYPEAFLPVFAYLTTAATSSDAIFSGYCCEVASMTPALTLRTPAQPPSTETIVTSPLLLPAFLRAVQAPAAL